LKLSLGTVQFGVPYGINNTTGVPDDDEIALMFDLAWTSGIEMLDTAAAYGNAEQKIASLSGVPFKIVSKFSKTTSAVTFQDCLTATLHNLSSDSIYGYMAHNAETLLQNPILWDGMLQAKEKNQVVKIGYSLYRTEQLDKLLEEGFVADLVQIPYSLLDRKFEKYFPKLKDMGTEIHVRSVFLQGLYFRDTETLPKKLLPIKVALDKLHKICESFNIPVGSVALNFVAQNQYVDKVVIGVDSLQQLQQNINMVHHWKEQPEAIARIKAIEVSDQNLLIPANW